MPEIPLDRRTIMKIAGAGLIGSTASAGGASADQGELQQQLDTAASATEQYRDPKAALDAGFVLLGPYVTGMGWHFFSKENLNHALQNGLQIDKPQLLTYDDAGGNLKLGSVEYAIPVGARGYGENNPPDLFADEGTDVDEHWHIHPQAEHAIAFPPPPPSGTPDLDEMLHTSRWVEVVYADMTEKPVFNRGETIVTDFNGGGRIDPRVVLQSSVHPDLWTLHAWVHKKNPDGVFHHTNKTLANAPRR